MAGLSGGPDREPYGVCAAVNGAPVGRLARGWGVAETRGGSDDWAGD